MRFVNRIFIFAFLAAVLIAGAATASAQQATFHLPVEAKWGDLVLPPGDYNVRLPEPSLDTYTVAVHGPAVGYIMVMSTDTYGARNAGPGHDYLQLVQVNGVYYVTKFEESTRLTTLYFSAPQGTRQKHMARNVINVPAKRS